MKTKTVFSAPSAVMSSPDGWGRTACGSWNTIVEQESCAKNKTGVKPRLLSPGALLLKEFPKSRMRTK